MHLFGRSFLLCWRRISDVNRAPTLSSCSNEQTSVPGLGAWVWLNSSILILLCGGLMWMRICSLWQPSVRHQVFEPRSGLRPAGGRTGQGVASLWKTPDLLTLFDAIWETERGTRKKNKIFFLMDERMNKWILGVHGETLLWVFHLIFLLSILVRCLCPKHHCATMLHTTCCTL